MRLYAIADLHLGRKPNRDFFANLEPRPEDGLIICGDVGETAEHLITAFQIARSCFQHIFWVPGNHELYTFPEDTLKGEAKYRRLVDIAREWGVLTPEDPYMEWRGEGGPCIIAPIFTLYDYSFRPDNVARKDVLTWAKEDGVEATDEHLLFSDPHETKENWCHALVEQTERRLREAASKGLPLVIINHWPLREDLIYIPRIPRFRIWCGTKKTEDWHQRFNAKVVVTGHLHVRRTDWIDGVRFEECSLGYPYQWEGARDNGHDINSLLREILPGPPVPESGNVPTIWRRFG